MSLPDPEFPRNDASHSTTYSDSVYTFPATGGFTMEREFDTIKLAEQLTPSYVDVTDAIQIKMDVATFNTKLDLSSFSAANDSFGVDEITINAEELTAGVTSDSQIISVGKYSTLYSDFQTYVANYFGTVGGFSSLFVAASEFAIDPIVDGSSNVFDGASFIALLTASAQDPSGRRIAAMTGSITIANIANILKFSVDGNLFGNRDPTDTNWGVENGFVAGDLIWVPSGTTITLKLAIDAEAFAPLNNGGTAQGSALALSQNTAFTSGENFSQSTVATTELITRVVTAPLLIKLVTV